MPKHRLFEGESDHAKGRSKGPLRKRHAILKRLRKQSRKRGKK